VSSFQTQQKFGHRFYHRLRSTNPWPDSIQPDLRPAITEYVTHGLDVADRLRDAMCLALNVDPRELAPFFANSDDGEPNFWSLKLVSYPPISDDTRSSSIAESRQGRPHG
jgi:isopenicillin N synthase-like dioxygenase